MTATTLLTTRERNLLRRIGIAPTAGVDINFSRDDFWLDEHTASGDAADFVIEWHELTVDAHYDEPNRTPRYEYGTFNNLPTVFTRVLSTPNRCPDSLVELSISEWAAHYRAIQAAA
ncbi:hypothetical protein [Rhodococcoides fascians]|uniref:hypothetical protein n=1 Tax=Rhodococcoides fascians TaxID=1828 RepID=UPI000566FDD6|nr:hypothetical protein [Rhodococcus fascians]